MFIKVSVILTFVAVVFFNKSVTKIILPSSEYVSEMLDSIPKSTFDILPISVEHDNQWFKDQLIYTAVIYIYLLPLVI